MIAPFSVCFGQAETLSPAQSPSLPAQQGESIRERLTANAERDAASITERMGIPATLLLLGFMIFLGFPAIYVLFQ